MKIIYSPVEEEMLPPFEYTFKGEVIEIEHPTWGKSRVDFSGLPNGALEKGSIKSEFPLPPIEYVERVNGEVYCVLRQFVLPNDERDKRYPEWFDPGTGEKFPTNEDKEWILER